MRENIIFVNFVSILYCLVKKAVKDSVIKSTYYIFLFQLALWWLINPSPPVTQLALDVDRVFQQVNKCDTITLLTSLNKRGLQYLQCVWAKQRNLLCREQCGIVSYLFTRCTIWRTISHRYLNLTHSRAK